MLIYDWLIAHRKTGLYLSKFGVTKDPEKSLFWTGPRRRPYTKASFIKQAIFAQSPLTNLQEKDFKVMFGFRERQG